MGRTNTTGPVHDRAAICAIGDELTLGQNTDTNSAWLAGRLASLGVVTIEHATVPDDLGAIANTIERLAANAPLVICTGGLGPTPDDCTRQALAMALNEELIEDPEALAWLHDFAAKLSKPLPDSNRIQAMRPASATLIHNPHGTAPGVHTHMQTPAGHADIYCLPGPPREMRPMFDNAVAPAIDSPGAVVRTRFINSFGVGESSIAERLADLLARDASPTVGLTTDDVDVRFRIRAESDQEIEGAAKRILESMGHYVFSEGLTPLAEVIVNLLKDRDERLATVESCTGGLLGAMITSIPGSSAVYSGGWLTYSNAMKEATVRVPKMTIEKFGAVSEPVARAMAEGAILIAPDGGADHALAITGIAGPDGGSDEKPIGTVFIARASRTLEGSVRTQVRHFCFTGDRELVRKRSAQAALAMLRFHILGDGERPLIWQIN